MQSQRLEVGGVGFSDEGAVQFVLEHSADCRVLYPQNVSEEIVSIMSRATLLNSW